MIDFNNKIIVITGGLGLIGKRICEAFLDLNGTVVICDVQNEIFNDIFKKNTYKNKLYFQKMDISKPDEIKSSLKKMIDKYSKIHVWVNAAYPRTENWCNTIGQISYDSWNKNVQMHLGGYFWTSKLILEHMKKNREGCLINFGSIYGIVGPNFDIYKNTEITMPVAYSAIKGGIVNLSRFLAALYGPYGVRVNTICPGGVFDHQDKKFVENYSKNTPLKRMAKDYEIAMPVVFLASDAASYITGHTLMVDGGWTSI